MGRYSCWSVWVLGAFVLLAVAAGGCSRGPSLPPLAPVSGTVTLDGKALPGARVEFVPDADKKVAGPPAVGVTDENGHYELTTLRQKGAAIGMHRVAVDARPPRKDTTAPPSRSLIPERYNHSETSKLGFEVKKVEKGEENQINLPLTSNP